MEAEKAAVAIELIQMFPEMISSAVEANPAAGYAAIFLAMFLENLFPPIPSELIMPLGGFYVHRGTLAFLPVVLAGLLGTVLGALPWFSVGRLAYEERIERWLLRRGRWIGINTRDLNRSCDWFRRHGDAVVFWGRLLPGVRTLISLPAGIERMPIVPFLIFTTAGSLIWILLLTIAGLLLGESYRNVELWIEAVSRLIKVMLLVGLLAGAVWLALRALRNSRNRL